MASRRLASCITLSAGTKTNSASLSTNFLINHGQATRSTLTRSRVIHFIEHLQPSLGLRSKPPSRQARYLDDREPPAPCGDAHAPLRPYLRLRRAEGRLHQPPTP